MRAVRLALVPEIEAPCEICEGRRFESSVLGVRYRGASVADVLAMTFGEARRHFAAWPEVERRLRTLEGAGLGHLVLGQRSAAISSGEMQRLRLARALANPAEIAGTLYLLDDPASGLHGRDAAALAALLHAFVDRGASVIAAENLPGFVDAADEVITLGPGVGPAGGEVSTPG